MSAAAPEALDLSPDGLALICDFLYRRTGMTFGEKKRYYIERRVADRMKATGQRTFAGYFGVLRSDPREAEALINAFTVNETYFYREAHQLRCLSQDILPELIKGRRPGDKIRIWCNPCSTGEEPYSVALWLLENWRLVDAYNVEIVGSDIDSRALEAARDGWYGDRALARLPAPVIEAYFEPAVRGRRRIIADLRESISLSSVNLIDREAMAAHGRFDVVFCRNVLIYFDDVARRTAIDLLHDVLSPGGFLCLGHTESLARITDNFRLRRFTDALVYQRAGEG